MDVKACLGHHNPDAERNILGRCLFDRTTFLKFWQQLKPEYFYIRRDSYAYLNDQAQKNNALDIASLGNAPDHVLDLLDFSGILPAENYYADLLKSFRIRETAKAILTADENNLPEMTEAILKISSESNQYRTYTMREAAEVVIAKWERGEKSRKSYHLGIPVVDDMVRLRSGNIAFIVAPPKTGKTWLECVIASFLSIGNRVYYVSCEMHPEDLFTRIASTIAGCDLTPLDYDVNPPKHLYSAFSENVNKIIERNLTMCNARGISFSELKGNLYAAIHGGFDIIIIDYLQRVNTDTDDLRVATLTMSRELTNLAAKHDKVFIVASQAGRAARNVEYTRAHHAKESSAIEEDADLVLSLTDKTDMSTYQNGEPYIMAIDVMQRNGWRGLVTLNFNPSTGRLTDPKVKKEEEQYFA